MQEVNFPVSDLVESGSPVSVMFMGKTRADILEGEVTIKVNTTYSQRRENKLISCFLPSALHISNGHTTVMILSYQEQCKI